MVSNSETQWTVIMEQAVKMLLVLTKGGRVTPVTLDQDLNTGVTGCAWVMLCTCDCVVYSLTMF